MHFHRMDDPLHPHTPRPAHSTCVISLSAALTAVISTWLPSANPIFVSFCHVKRYIRKNEREIIKFQNLKSRNNKMNSLNWVTYLSKVLISWWPSNSVGFAALIHSAISTITTIFRCIGWGWRYWQMHVNVHCRCMFVWSNITKGFIVTSGHSRYCISLSEDIFEQSSLCKYSFNHHHHSIRCGWYLKFYNVRSYNTHSDAINMMDQQHRRHHK